MCESTKGTRLVRLCETDDLYSATGHPLTRTYYYYDQEGMIEETVKQFHFCENINLSPGFPMRESTHDPFGIIASEDVYSEENVGVEVPRIILYEKDETGRVRQVIEAAVDAATKQYFSIIYTIGYDNTRPHQRGHIIRERHLEPDGSFAWEYRYHYDDHGWKVRTQNVSPEGPLDDERRIIIEYDGYGNTIYYNNGHEFAIENAYDGDGYLKTALVKEKSMRSGEWELIGRHEYSYRDYEIADTSKTPEPT